MKLECQLFSMEPQSVIDGLGDEITSIVTPVSICMFIVVCLVHGLTPHGSDSGASPFIATSFYHEKSTDSTEAKLSGALLNALIFILAVAAVTFVLVALFYFRCMKVGAVVQALASLVRRQKGAGFEENRRIALRGNVEAVSSA